MPLCKSTLWILFGLTLAYSLIAWNTTATGSKFLTALVKCILPSIFALIIGGIHSVISDGDYPVREGAIVAVSYIIICMLVRFFSNVLIDIVLGIVIVGIAFVVISIFVKQGQMDFHFGNRLNGDDEKVRQLWKEGYRPAGYYHDASTKNEGDVTATTVHGINPYEDKD